jgi:hypothetical protein
VDPVHKSVYKRQCKRPPRFREGPLTCNHLVAGAGFEPLGYEPRRQCSTPHGIVPVVNSIDDGSVS